VVFKRANAYKETSASVDRSMYLHKGCPHAYGGLFLCQIRIFIDSLLQRLSRELDGPFAGSMTTDEARSVHENAARQAGRV